MPNACCCYVIDAGYLFPTLMSAIQARSAIAVSAADVTILCIGQGRREIDLFAPICREHGIGLVSVPPSAIDHMPIMFGRFYLARLLDAHYEAVVYMDGDITVLGAVGSGAEIVAGGSIHIYGTLRGRAMAGANGNARARIFCQRVDAELLAIGTYYTTAEDIDVSLRRGPAQAWLEGSTLKISAMN